MPHFRKKPVIIQAVRFDGVSDVDGIPTSLFGGDFEDLPEWLRDAQELPMAELGAIFENGDGLMIRTIEGDMRCSPGDWIIEGTAGELYPCKPDIFAAIYDPVNAEAADALYGQGNHEVTDPPGVGRTELTAGKDAANA